MRPERRTSGSLNSGSSGPRCGTCRWQKRQRMGFEGQVFVRWWDREGMDGNVEESLQAGQV